MQYCLRTLGNNPRHMTSFERNTINRLNQVISLDRAEIIYDETLFDVDDKYYVLLSVLTVDNKKVTTTTDGETKFEALIKAVSLAKQKLQEIAASNQTEVVHLQNSRMLQQAV